MATTARSRDHRTAIVVLLSLIPLMAHASDFEGMSNFFMMASSIAIGLLLLVAIGIAMVVRAFYTTRCTVVAVSLSSVYLLCAVSATMTYTNAKPRNVEGLGGMLFLIWLLAILCLALPILQYLRRQGPAAEAIQDDYHS